MFCEIIVPHPLDDCLSEYSRQITIQNENTKLISTDLLVG